MKLAGKIGVVVGGARGMGYACVDALLGKGAKVFFGDLVDKAEAESVLEKLRKQYGQDSAYYIKCDVRKPDEIEALFQLAEEKCGKVEVFVNVAGMIHEFDWEKCLDVNVRGNIHCMTAALAHMGKDKGGLGGAITIMSSIGGLAPFAWGPVYCGSKHFIVGYCRTWAEPWNFDVHGIRINTLCPTAVESQFATTSVIDEAEQRIHHPQITREMTLAMPDKFEPSIAGEALLQILEDDDVNGKAVRMTRAHGIDYAKFQPAPAQ